MLRNREKHTKSLSCSTLKKEIARIHPSLPHRKYSQKKFIPFLSERRLGKLIIDQPEERSSLKGSSELLLEKVNFRNFKKIYQVLLNFQNRKYAEQTRSSGQKDLINQEWRLKVLSLPSSKFNSKLQSSRSSQLLPEKISEKEDKFQKMNRFLFKKLSAVGQPSNNPEFQQIYNNYIQICQMNENIRRAQMLGKAQTSKYI